MCIWYRVDSSNCIWYRVDSKEMLVTFLHCMLWGMLIHFMACYILLESWSNLFGELLRFADREFYLVSIYVK